MLITAKEMQAYQEQGFMFVPDCIDLSEIQRIKEELPALYQKDAPNRTLEKDGKVVRSIYGSHMTNTVCQDLARHPRLVNVSQEILKEQVYIYQFKINAKAAFGGDAWEWHQDYIFWHHEDNVSSPDLVNVMIFLDDVNEFNGPLLLIPGSHREGMIESEVNQTIDPAYKDNPAWISDLTVNLKYALGKEKIFALVQRYGLMSAKGTAGTALFFHPNIVHSSSSNMSPSDRNVAIITYNSVVNQPQLPENARPDFLVSRDAQAVVPLEERTLSIN